MGNIYWAIFCVFTCQMASGRRFVPWPVNYGSVVTRMVLHLKRQETKTGQGQTVQIKIIDCSGCKAI